MTGRVDAPSVSVARFADLDAPTLYEIMVLRVDVFVVEQRCAYRELDGLDTAPDTLHLWLPHGGAAVAAYLRMLDEGAGVTRIGRVVTERAARGHGLADRLLRDALGRAPGPVVADAQAHLAGWYAARGFVVSGPEFVEDGIPHVPMRADGIGP